MEEQTIGKGALVVTGAVGFILLAGFLYVFLIALATMVWIAWDN